MAKKTIAEYEATIGGLAYRLEHAQDKYGNAMTQWEQWAERANKAEAHVVELEEALEEYKNHHHEDRTNAGLYRDAIERLIRARSSAEPEDAYRNAARVLKDLV